LYGVGGGLGLALLAQAFFIFYAVSRAPQQEVNADTTVGKTLSIGQSMYTEYLLPVEIVGVMLLMAIIGGVVLARRLSQPQLELIVNEELDERNQEEEENDLRVSL
jgi:NADH:ubiquinone oxidoreductase subunit 6 (subunit J)